jgi:hypothetical protein
MTKDGVAIHRFLKLCEYGVFKSGHNVYRYCHICKTLEMLSGFESFKIVKLKHLGPERRDRIINDAFMHGVRLTNTAKRTNK